MSIEKIEYKTGRGSGCVIKPKTSLYDDICAFGHKNDDPGAKGDNDKPDWTLIPIGSLIWIIKVLMFGERKYKRDDWKRVPDARRRYLSAAFRHISAVADGEWVDEESGLPHLAHAGCCILFLLWFGIDEVKT